MAVDSYGTQNQPYFDGTKASNLAADLSAVSDYAAKVGNHKTGSNAARAALTGADLWEGLHWTNTDNGAEWRYRSGAWQPAPSLGSTVTSGVLTPASGWTFSGGNQNFILVSDWLVWCYAHLVRSGGTITVPSDGNLSNLTVATASSSWTPVATFPFGSGLSGRLVGAAANSDGTFTLNAVTPGTNIANGDHISFGGLYLRNRGY